MIKNFISIIGLSVLTIPFAIGQRVQRVDYHYHGINYSEIRSYDLQILSLFSDSTYIYQYQRYMNKKEYKNQIINDFQIEYGTWNVMNDTIFIKSKDELRKTAFLKIKNKIYYWGEYPIDKRTEEYLKKERLKNPFKKI